MPQLPGALVVIDVQRALFHSAVPPHEADLVVERIDQVATRARAAGVPVVFVQHERPGTPLAYDTSGWELHERLQVHPGDHLLRKATPDAFLGTRLAALLEAEGVDHLAVCGYATEFCIDTTVRRAAALGYHVTLVADAHTTHDKPHLDAATIRAHHNATLPEISSFDVLITTVESAGLAFARAREPAVV